MEESAGGADGECLEDDDSKPDTYIGGDEVHESETTRRGIVTETSLHNVQSCVVDGEEK